MDPKWTNKNATQLRFVNGTHRDSTGTFSIERTLLGTNFGHDKQNTKLEITKAENINIEATHDKKS